MKTTGTRHTAITLATATAVAAALTIMSVGAPTAASANLPDPFAGTATQCGEDVGSTGTVDGALDIAHRKAQMAQYYIDHALELHRPAAR